MTKPRPDRPTEPLSIWMRTHSAPGKARKRAAASRWPVSRLFWGGIAGIALAAIGLFTAALLIGPVHVPGRLVSVPSTTDEVPAVASPVPVSSSADPAPDPASSAAPRLLTVPSAAHISLVPMPARRTAASVLPASAAPAPAGSTGRVSFSVAASSPSPAHSHWPSPAPPSETSPAPDPVISSQPAPTQGDSGPSTGFWPSDYEAP